MTQEIDQSEKLTGTDRQLQILNGIASWVQALDDNTRDKYMRGLVAIPESVFSKEAIEELIAIGTAVQIFDAAMCGISVSDPREVVSPWDTDIID